MRVPMMHVGVVRVAMRDRYVAVRMRVRLHAVPREIVFVLMVFVVLVRVSVLERLVRVRVVVTFAHVQPDAERHQREREPEGEHRALRPQQQ